jgi:hypothetical protein
MSASVAATLVLFTALVAGFTACGDKDDDNNNNNSEPLYTPSKNMTQADILKLFKEVDANMASVRVMSSEEITTSNTAGQKKTLYQFNADTKKELEERYQDKGTGLTLQYFDYVEGSTKYEYESKDFNESGKEVKNSYKISDIYWNKQLSEEFPELEKEYSTVTWTVEGNAFVTNFTQYEGTEEEDHVKVTVTITESKKIASFKDESSYKRDGKDVLYAKETKYTYSIDPAMPSNFKPGDFSPRNQYSLKVIWGAVQGKNLGESTIYAFIPEGVQEGLIYIPNDILNFAPKVEGKTPRLYSDPDHTQLEATSLYLTDNSKVLYAEWVDTPAN